MTTESSPASANTGGDIVARAGRYYRNTRYIMFAVLLIMGAWFTYDGLVGWPKGNAEIAKLEAQQAEATKRNDQAELGRIATELKKYKKHSDWDLGLQYILGFGLPPLGLALLIYSLHRSRGEYRLSGTKLSVPGHPTIDLDDIKSVNNDLWDRKGIVYLKYETPAGQSGEIVLDDFIYDRPPTDQIYDVIAEKFGLETDDDKDEDVDDDEESDKRDDRDDREDVDAPSRSDTAP